jgi:uncharacterized membrane protein
MRTSGALVTFLIVVFCLAAVLILKKESIPATLRRPMAITTLVMVVAAFIMLMVSFFTASAD